MTSRQLTGLTVESQFAAIALVTSPQSGPWIDTIGYGYYLFIVQAGNISATQTMDFKLQYSTDGSTLGGDISGATLPQIVDGDDLEERSLLLHVDASPGRWIRSTFTQANNPAVTVTAVGFPRTYVGGPTVANSASREHPTVRVTA